MSLPFAGRLATLGATPGEIAAIQAGYEIASVSVQDGVDSLIAAVDNAGLSVMLSNWRAGAAFSAGLPGSAPPGRPVGRRRVEKPDPPEPA